MRTCRKCNAIIPNRIIIDGIERILCNRKFCLICSPFNKHNTSPFDPIKRKAHVNKPYRTYSAAQKEQIKKSLYLKAYQRKHKLVEQKGGGCQRCRYSKSIRALTFHHIDPSSKLFGLTLNNLWSKSEEEIALEASKCELLCMNCHAEVEEAASIERCSDILKEVKRSFKLVTPAGIAPASSP